MAVKKLSDLPQKTVADNGDGFVITSVTGQDMRVPYQNLGITELKSDVDDLQANQLASTIGFETKALMDADLDHDAGTVAQVMNDATAANNGYYRKDGASGTGSWVKRVSFYAETLDPADTSEAVVGKAVNDWTNENFVNTSIETASEHINYAVLNEDGEAIEFVTEENDRFNFYKKREISLDQVIGSKKESVQNFDLLLLNDNEEVVFATHPELGIVVPKLRENGKEDPKNQYKESQSADSISNANWNAFSNFPSILDFRNRLYTGTVGDATENETAPLYIGIKNRQNNFRRVLIGSVRGSTGTHNNHNNPVILADERDNAEFPVIIFQSDHNTHKLRMKRFDDLDLDESESWREIGVSNVAYATCFRNNNEIIVFCRKQGATPRPWIIYYSTDNGETWSFKDFATSDQSLFYLTVRPSNNGLHIITWNHPNFGDQGFGYMHLNWDTGAITTLADRTIYSNFRDIFTDANWSALLHLTDSEQIYTPPTTGLSATPHDISCNGSGKIRVIFEEYPSNPDMADFNLSEYKLVQTDIPLNNQDGVYVLNEGGMSYRNQAETNNANLAGSGLCSYDLAIISIYKNDSQLSGGTDLTVQDGLTQLMFVYLGDIASLTKTEAGKFRRKIFLPMPEKTKGDYIGLIDAVFFNEFDDYSTDLKIIRSSDFNFKGY